MNYRNILTTKQKIEYLYNNFKKFLIEKNKRYGNSVFDPIHIFSESDSETQIRVRLDDKLKRIIYSKDLRKNDVCDLFGYLSLLLISKDWIDFEDLLD